MKRSQREHSYQFDWVLFEKALKENQSRVNKTRIGSGDWKGSERERETELRKRETEN